MEAPVAPTTSSKPQKVQTIGILAIISGATNIILGLGFMVGFALSVVLICCAPVGVLPMALGVFELIYGIRLVGSGQEPVTHQTIQTIAILEIVTILLGNLPSCVIGIVNLILLNDPESMTYFGKS